MEDDRQYEYDGPDSEREPVHEEPAAMGEKPAAAGGAAADRCEESGGGIGQGFDEMDRYPDQYSRQPEEWTQAGYQQEENYQPNIGRKRIIRTNTDRTDTSSKPDITGTNTGRR